MTDILENAASDSSENEDISRLFPRYKPKIPNDFNLNRVMTKHARESSPTPSHFPTETNANELECQTNGISESVVVNENDILSIHSNSDPPNQEQGYEEDHSVVSAYGMFGINCASHEGLEETSEGDGTGDSTAVSGCFNASGFQEFKLRESRIEIAGGREVFSSNRIRYSRKRFTDEMICCQSKNLDDGHGDGIAKCDGNGSGCQEKRVVRRNAEKIVGNEIEEKATGSKTSAVIHPYSQKGKWDVYDSVVVPQDVQLANSNKTGSEPMVYETQVDGSEVIFDDIGFWKGQPTNLDVGLDPECISIFNQRMEYLSKSLTLSTEVLNSEDDDETSSSHSPIKKLTLDKTVRDPRETYTDDEVLLDDELSKDEDESQESTRTVHRKFIALIGNVPIAEYEGSPRRYGPRPGHPERIVANDVDKGYYQGEMDEVLKLTCHPSPTTPLEDKMKPETKFDSCLLRTDNNHVNCSMDESQKLKSADLELGSSKSKTEYSTSASSSSYVGRRLAHFQGCISDDGSLKTLTDQFLLEKNLHPSLLRDCYSNVVGKNVEVDDAMYLSEMMDGGGATGIHDKNAFLDEDRDTISTNPDTEDLGETEMGEQVGQSRNFTLSPETTDCDSNDVESEVSYENDESVHSGSHALGSMPVLEDGLSSGQESEVDDADGENEAGNGTGDRRRHHSADNPTTLLIKKQISEIEKEIARRSNKKLPTQLECDDLKELLCQVNEQQRVCATDDDLDFDPLSEALDRVTCSNSSTCLPGVAHSTFHKCDEGPGVKKESVDEAIKEIREAILNVKAIPVNMPTAEKAVENEVPVWLPRPLYNQQKLTDDGENKGQNKLEDAPEEECDTDQETDQLLGKQRMDDKGFYDDKEWCKQSAGVMSKSSATGDCNADSVNGGSDTEQKQSRKDKENKDQKKGRSKEVLIHEPAVLIEGVLFRARYLGSTQLVCEGQPTKATRMMQAEEAVSRIKAPEGENQPSTEVDLFISTEKIMVLNTDLKEIMMDHSLRTISYIADIGDLVVLMARRRMMSCQEDQDPKIRRTPKMICHVFESEEAQFIAQSIGQAFQVAYMEFLKANGIEDHSFVKEMDYQEVLNSQEIYGDELEMFAKKEMQKEVIVPKARGEMLGVVIVESGWGSMLPTVVIANLSPSGAAARCGQLNIGDQIIAINGISLVGLPLSTCQNYIKNAKTQMVVKLTVVPCAPVVEVKIKRPDTKYQLGFSVQNGVICSLLRGGIAERGGVRVGHRIIEINGQSVVAVPHERIVSLLATSVGEILMKTMPTSMFRLLTGQETPVYI